MSYLTISQLNTLEEFAFIGGTEYTLEYTVYNTNGIDPLDISSATTKLYICPYGQPDYAVLEKNGVLSMTTGKFTVTLSSTDTATLSGKFIQQPTVIDFEGNEFRFAQGLFTILPKIQ